MAGCTRVAVAETVPEAEAVIRPSAILRAARDVAAELYRTDDDIRTELRRKGATIRALETALDGSTQELDRANDTIAQLRPVAELRSVRSDQLRELEARIAELEAERAWKPWPPVVRDRRHVVARTKSGNLYPVLACNEVTGAFAYFEIPAYVPPEVKP